MKKKKQTIEVVPTERRKNPPRTAFQKGGPNPHAFQPGNEPANKGGGPHKMHLVSRALKVHLANRAPRKWTMALGISSHASIGQCLSYSLVRRAIGGDLQAASLVLQYTEGAPKQHLTFDDVSSEQGDRRVEVVFIESDGDGRPRVLPKTLEGDLDDEGPFSLPSVTD